MTDLLSVELWEAVAADLRRHWRRRLGIVMTEDVVRFTTAEVLADDGVDPAGMRIGHEHPVLAGLQIDLTVGGDAPTGLIEFACDSDRQGQPTAGDLRSDLSALSAYPGEVRRILVHLESAASRRSDVDSARRVDADRICTLWVDDDVRLCVYDVSPVDPPVAPPPIRTGVGPESPAAETRAFAGGYLQDGEQVDGPGGLQDLLQWWVDGSDCPTIGRVPPYGGRPVVALQIGADTVRLNADTSRESVRQFLDAAVRAGGADRLPWWVVANRYGRVNLVTFRADQQPVPGWYAYLGQEETGPRPLGRLS